MTDILPFGSDSAEATVDLGPQTFLGLSVVDINCTSSWDQQGGQCTLRLLQDTDQYLEQAVVGSPQYFEIETLSGEPVFRFYGILKELSRSVDSSSKEYTAVIQSPTILLEACSIITEAFAGYGGAIEAGGANIPLCLDFGHTNSNINPLRIFNIQNVFGVYENSSYGVAGAGFGKSNITEDGMRVDLFAKALHELVNGNPDITPVLGSNIIYGSDDYAGGNAYAYNFDIYGFLAQLSDYIPSNYRVKSTNLLDFVNEICSLANFIYYVDLLKPVGAGLASFGTEHQTNLTPVQTHSGTVYGGQIVVITQNRNTVSSVPFPLSKEVIAKEASDKLGGSGPDGTLPLDMGLTGTEHPEGPPVASSPYGGEFPVESISTDDEVRYTSTNLSVRLNESAVAAKYVVGGYQSRINYVYTAGINRNKQPEIMGSTCSISPPPDLDTTADVYEYYGFIDLSARVGYEVPNVPVIVHPSIVALTHIPVDVYNLFGNLTIQGWGSYNGKLNAGPIINGIYFCSTAQFVNSKISFKKWVDNLPVEYNEAFNKHFQKIFSPNFYTYDSNGNLTSYGRAAYYRGVNIVNQYNTAAEATERINGYSDYLVAYAARHLFLRKLYDRIKYIAENHYGKTYAVKCPAFATALDADGFAPLNSFIRSWDIAPDAYLDPINYPYYEAPYNDSFVSNGRLKAYVVYDNRYNSYYPDNNIAVEMELGYPISFNDMMEHHIDPFTSNTMYITLTPINPDFPTSVNIPDVAALSVDLFSDNQYQPGEVFKTRSPNGVPITCIPAEVFPDYIFIPPIYFTYISIKNFMPPIGTSPSHQININIFGQANLLANLLTSLPIPVNGEGCVPFAIVKVNGLFFSKKERDIKPVSSYQEETPWSHLDAAEPAEQHRQVAIIPRGFGIPQQSNRYVYGPWITNVNLNYGAKIEYVRDENLVPENYVIPNTINIGGIVTTVGLGYEGMNTVGQLIANTVENFDYFFTEEGSVSVPGLPVVTSLGQSLVVEGPLVSDISFNLTADSLSTQYSMKTFAPKFGRANKFIIDQLTRIGRNVSRK